jgi:hypothetical protein
MTTTINADDGVVSGSAGLKYSSDSSGELALQTNGTTAVTVDASQNVTLAKNLAFTGTGNRITGDFSNATVANRVMFQNSVVNASTLMYAVPNGTGTIARWRVVNNSSDFVNSSQADFGITSTEAQISSSITGTGTYLPMTFFTGGSERVRIDTSGNLLVTNAAGLGYGTGSGGTVTQATSKSTAVTLNKPTGVITMNNAALDANTTVAFGCTNSMAAAIDTVVLTPLTSTIDMSFYQWGAAMNGAGNIRIYLRNISGGSRSEAVVFNFTIIKGATS